MTSVRRMRATDLFSLNAVNLDRYTENYHVGFYTHYMLHWPALNVVATSFGRPVAYVMAKSEGAGGPHAEEPWHGHLSALTVAPAWRRAGLARRLMAGLEAACAAGGMHYVDLYVRESNAAAREMYAAMGYVDYRRVREYYSEPREDALDMRKALGDEAARLCLRAPRAVIHARDL